MDNIALKNPIPFTIHKPRIFTDGIWVDLPRVMILILNYINGRFSHLYIHKHIREPPIVPFSFFILAAKQNSPHSLFSPLPASQTSDHTDDLSRSEYRPNT